MPGGEEAAERAGGVHALGERTHGFSPADCAHLLRTAVSIACSESAAHDAHRTPSASAPAGASSLTTAHFEAALARVKPSLLADAAGSAPAAVPLSSLCGISAAVNAALGALAAHMTHAHVYHELGVQPPRGLLLHGPHGSGKTSLAHALGHAAQSRGLANCIVLSGPDLVSALVGATEAALSAAFARARQLAPCVLIFDQFEAIAPRRRLPGMLRAARPTPHVRHEEGEDSDAGSDAEDDSSRGGGGGGGAAHSFDRLLSVLLTEMDGMNSTTAQSTDPAYTLPSLPVARASVMGDDRGAAAVPAHVLLAAAVRDAPLAPPAPPAPRAISIGSVFIIAVTHDKSLLDEAVLRPGRLDVHIELALPDAAARAAILRAYFSKSPCDPASFNIHEPATCAALVDETQGWAAADLQGLWKEAAMHALRVAPPEDMMSARIRAPDVAAAFAVIRQLRAGPDLEPPHPQDSARADEGDEAAHDVAALAA
ncbi:ATP-binding protein, partial [archaeon]